MLKPERAGQAVLLFDLDGTLIHSEPVAARSLIQVMSRHGFELQPSLADAVVGRTWRAAFEILSRHISFPVPPEKILEEVLEDYRIRLRDEVGEVPGATTAVQRLAADHRMAVVSGSFREEIEHALAKLGIRRHFEFILGAEDYPRSKPSADGYLKALAGLGADPRRAIVFEDSEAGIESGLTAGACVVSVTHCGSLPAASPWAARVHASIVDWDGVDSGWVGALLSRHGR